MQKSISVDEFVAEFQAWDSYKEKYSIPALCALYDYLESVNNVTPYKLDVVALACEFGEFKSCLDYTKETGRLSDGLEIIKTEEEAIDYLLKRTLIVGFDGGVLVSEF